MCKYYQKIDSYLYKCITEQEYVQLVKDEKAKAESATIMFIIWFFVIIIIHIIKDQIEKWKSKNEENHLIDLEKKS